MLFMTVYDEEIERYWEIYNDDTDAKVNRFDFSFNTNYYVLNLEIEENGYWVESKSKLQGRVVGNKPIRVGAHLEGANAVPEVGEPEQLEIEQLAAEIDQFIEKGPPKEVQDDVIKEDPEGEEEQAEDEPVMPK